MKNEVENIQATYASLYTGGLRRIAEASKTAMDLAAEQNAETLATCKHALKTSSIPGLFLFDLAGQAFEGYVALQKNLLDLAVEQSTEFVEAAQEISKNPEDAKDGVKNIIQQSLNRSVAAQKSVLDFAAKQSKAVSDAVKQEQNAV
jgi:hypothetical protein